MKTLDTTHQTFIPGKAEAIAKELNETDDWSYVVKHDPKGTGFSFIEIYDEDGEFVSRM